MADQRDLVAQRFGLRLLRGLGVQQLGEHQLAGEAGKGDGVVHGEEQPAESGGCLIAYWGRAAKSLRSV
ncbi:hypothetical protein D3C80_2190620 [compost metagenome]